MTRKRRLILTLMIAGALLLGIFLASREREPRWKGRTLSYWLTAYEKDRSSVDAPTAVHNIGTNALPLLVKWIGYKEPQWKITLNTIALQVGGNGLLRLVAPSESRAERAVTGFEILGPEAAPAIPALTNLLNWKWTSQGVNISIFRALNHMGNAGLAPLLSVAANKAVPPDLRAFAVGRVRDPLMHVDTNANWIVPLLADLLEDRMTGPQAAAALGDLRLDPPVAVPALIACVQDNGAWYNITAAESLGRFGKDATSAVPALVEALSSTNRYLRMAATNALEIIAPEVLKKDGH